MRTLPELYHAHICTCIGAEGVYPHQMMSRDAAGKLTVFSLAMSEPYGVMAAVHDHCFSESVNELIYSIDRFTKPNQGTKLADVLAGAFWSSCAWRPFVIEYRHQKRMVKPLQWENRFWNEAIVKELAFTPLTLQQRRGSG